MKNDKYVIGNNPTQFQQDEFKKLTEALKGNDQLAISEAVVRNFIADYFTGQTEMVLMKSEVCNTSMDQCLTSFQEQSRWEFYKDLDLYISQYGRENLLEVTDITTKADYAADFEHYSGETIKRIISKLPGITNQVQKLMLIVSENRVFHSRRQRWTL